MRTLKFRAWDKLNKKMVTDFSLNFTNSQRIRHWSFLISDVDYCDVNEVESIPALDDLIFMQYTGLKDKKGVEIYEGDLVSGSYMSTDNSFGVLPNGWSFNEDDVFEVIFDEKRGIWTFGFEESIPKDVQEEFGERAPAYMAKWKSHARHLLVGGEEGVGEVIGNIYQDKHLLDNPK